MCKKNLSWQDLDALLTFLHAFVRLLLATVLLAVVVVKKRVVNELSDALLDDTSRRDTAGSGRVVAH